MPSEIILSRLVVNRRHPAARQDLGNSQAMHRRLLDAFAVHSRVNLGLLYRVEPGAQPDEVLLLVQSATTAEWHRLPEGYVMSEASKRIDPLIATITMGAILRFRLRANPTRRIRVTEDTAKPGDRITGKHGTRQPLTEAELPAAMARKGEQHGFTALQWDARPDPLTGRDQIGRKGTRDSGRVIRHGCTVFEGLLQVSDVARFQATVRGGIGSAKAYGFGLLSIAPARRG